MSAKQCPAHDTGFPCVRVSGHEGQHQNKAHPRIKWGPSDAQRIASQSARIAELEAALKAQVERNRELSASNVEMATERDAVRKALIAATVTATRGKKGVTRTIVIKGDDGTPESVEAALLAAAREGGVK